MAGREIIMATNQEVVSLQDTETGMTPEEEAEFRRDVYEGKSEEPEKVVDDSTQALEKGKEDPETGKAKAAEPDPWEGVPTGVKEMFDSMASNSETRIKQLESRVGGLTNALSDAKKKTEAVREAAPTEEEIAEAAKSQEALDELVSDFPEWGNVFKGQFAAIRKEINRAGNTVETLKKKIDEGVDPQETLLTFFQPNWQEKVVSPEYQAWIKDQPDDVLAKQGSNLASEALDVLDAFDSDQAGEVRKTPYEIAEERRARMKASVNPKTDKSKAPKSEDAMTQAEFRQHAAKEFWP